MLLPQGLKPEFIFSTLRHEWTRVLPEFGCSVAVRVEVGRNSVYAWSVEPERLKPDPFSAVLRYAWRHTLIRTESFSVAAVPLNYWQQVAVGAQEEWKAWR